MDNHLNELAAIFSHSNSELAYKKVFRLLYDPLRRFSYSIVKSHEMSEEIASDVLLVIWQQRQRLCEIGNIKYYAFTIAKNKSLNLLKKVAGTQVLSIQDIDVDIEIYNSDPEAIFIRGEMIEKLRKAVSTLPKKCKLVFKLVREEGFSYKEVAEMLEISVKSVDSHLVFATKRLASVLRDEVNLLD